MKKRLLFVVATLNFMYSCEYSDMSNVAVLEVSSEIYDEATNKERDEIECRLDRQLKIIEKKENYTLVGGNNLKLMSIFREDTKHVLVSTDGGKWFMGYSLLPMKIIAGACFTGMSLRKNVCADSEDASNVVLCFMKKRFLIKDQKITLQFNTATQTWICEGQEGIRVVSDKTYSYNDLIS